MVFDINFNYVKTLRFWPEGCLKGFKKHWEKLSDDPDIKKGKSFSGDFLFDGFILDEDEPDVFYLYYRWAKYFKKPINKHFLFKVSLDGKFLKTYTIETSKRLNFIHKNKDGFINFKYKEGIELYN